MFFFFFSFAQKKKSKSELRRLCKDHLHPQKKVKLIHFWGGKVCSPRGILQRNENVPGFFVENLSVFLIRIGFFFCFLFFCFFLDSLCCLFVVVVCCCCLLLLFVVVCCCCE